MKTVQDYINEVNASIEHARPTTEEYLTLDGEKKEYTTPWDNEILHIDCDDIMKDALCNLGYKELVDAIENAEKLCGGF